jgi:hypothetical protein
MTSSERTRREPFCHGGTQSTESLSLPCGLSLMPCLKLLLTFFHANLTVCPLNESPHSSPSVTTCPYPSLWSLTLTSPCAASPTSISVDARNPSPSAFSKGDGKRLKMHSKIFILDCWLETNIDLHIMRFTNIVQAHISITQMSIPSRNWMRLV